MRRASDAVVDSADLVNAIEEIKRGGGSKIMGRLHQTEPFLAIHLENIAAQLAHPSKDAVHGTERALDGILTIVRAIELGNGRLWRNCCRARVPSDQIRLEDTQDRPHQNYFHFLKGGTQAWRVRRP